MSLKILLGVATAGSACVIVLALAAVAVIFRDINSLYDDVMVEMDDFKVKIEF